MLKTKVTENYTGITISGDYQDLNYLYDCIYYFLDFEAMDEKEEMVKNHIYGFLYDVRHAYQGDREVIQEDDTIYYSFSYVFTELVTDMVYLKNIICRRYMKKIDEFTVELNFIKYFYSLVIQSCNEFVGKGKINKFKKMLHDYPGDENIICPQWFDSVSVRYINSTKSERVKNFTSFMDQLINYSEYDAYYKMYQNVMTFLNENGEYFSNIVCCDYPDSIEW
ncbi:MAG: DUF6904 family protein [Traorella sp.]